jgi:hypothetical protein
MLDFNKHFVDESGSGEPTSGTRHPVIQSRAKIIVSARYPAGTFEWVRRLLRAMPAGQSIEDPVHVASLVASDCHARQILDTHLPSAAILLVDPVHSIRVGAPEFLPNLRHIETWPTELRHPLESYLIDEAGLFELEYRLGEALARGWSFKTGREAPMRKQILDRALLLQLKWQSRMEALARLNASMLDAVDPEFEDRIFSDTPAGMRIPIWEFAARPIRHALDSQVTFDDGKKDALRTARVGRENVAAALTAAGDHPIPLGGLVEAESSQFLGLLAAHLAASRAVAIINGAFDATRSVTAAVQAVAAQFERVFLNMERVRRTTA